MQKLIITMVTICITMVATAQTRLKQVYDETINPMEQIDQALSTAKSSPVRKYVICQVGGNWCPWCLRFADFITKDSDIVKTMDDNFVYIHVNYNPSKTQGEDNVKAANALMKRLGNPGRFGFPVFVVLDTEGKVLHIQDSSFLEEGQGYNKEKVLRFFNMWTPTAVNQ